MSILVSIEIRIRIKARLWQFNFFWNAKKLFEMLKTLWNVQKKFEFLKTLFEIIKYFLKFSKTYIFGHSQGLLTKSKMAIVDERFEAFFFLEYQTRAQINRIDNLLQHWLICLLSIFFKTKCQLLYISTLAIAKLGPAQSHLVIDAIQSANPPAKNRRNIGPPD